jgi:hypothetical protein
LVTCSRRTETPKQRGTTHSSRTLTVLCKPCTSTLLAHAACRLAVVAVRRRRAEQGRDHRHALRCRAAPDGTRARCVCVCVRARARAASCVAAHRTLTQ